MSWFNRLFGSEPEKSPESCLLIPTDVDSPSLQDTISSIDELSLAVHNNPDAVEIYLALGNLYRSKGELERAAHIRNNIIIRPGLDEKFKARAWFELGLDYRRAGLLDRALAAFNEVKKIGKAYIPELNKHLAQLAEDSGEFEKAADYYKDMGLIIPQAHALVRLAQSCYADNQPHEGKRRLRQALDVFAGAPDAWLLELHQAWINNSALLPDILRQAIKAVCPDMRFILIEAFFEKIQLQRPGQAQFQPANDRSGQPEAEGRPSPEAMPQKYQHLIHALSDLPDNLLPDFHLARVYFYLQDMVKAKEHLNRCLLNDPNFWPAHLELLYLAIITEKVPPLLKTQLEYFISRKRKLNCYFCRKCGLHSERVFFLCPRCRSWYSVALRDDMFD